VQGPEISSFSLCAPEDEVDFADPSVVATQGSDARTVCRLIRQQLWQIVRYHFQRLGMRFPRS
jgi:hypothetical protein